MIRFLSMSLALAGCQLQERPAPMGPEPRQCRDLETALEATRSALDDRRFEWLGQLIRDVFVDGRLSPELAAQLDSPESLTNHLEGDHLRTLVGVIVQGLAQLVPVETLRGLQNIVSEDASIGSLMAFMDAQPTRWNVLDPVREMFSSCRDGGDLADLMVHLPLVEGQCEEVELLCALDHLVVVLKSPDLAESLSSVDFEGRVGREAFQQLILHVMDVPATPGFDSEALAAQLRNLFGERLDDTTLDALDGLMASFGAFMSNPDVQQPWSRVVSCVKRYDPERAVSGLTYDMLTDGGLNSGTTARVLSETKGRVEADQMMLEWSRMATFLAADPALRERLSFGLRPLLVPTLFRWISPKIVELQERGVLAEWLRLVEEGLPCED
ncbi:MAG: hypothetical protein VX405_06000 [Myxococcota bacterium]|nr:hypothetical protein [Myxococcota bacterium]